MHKKAIAHNYFATGANAQQLNKIARRFVSCNLCDAMWAKITGDELFSTEMVAKFWFLTALAAPILVW